MEWVHTMDTYGYMDGAVTLARRVGLSLRSWKWGCVRNGDLKADKAEKDDFAFLTRPALALQRWLVCSLEGHRYLLTRSQLMLYYRTKIGEPRRIQGLMPEI